MATENQSKATQKAPFPDAGEPQSFRFLELPLELRYFIYRELCKTKPRSLAILRVSKQVSEEAQEIVLEEVEFSASVIDIARCSRFRRPLPRPSLCIGNGSSYYLFDDCRPSPLEFFSRHGSGPRWKKGLGSARKVAISLRLSSHVRRHLGYRCYHSTFDAVIEILGGLAAWAKAVRRIHVQVAAISDLPGSLLNEVLAPLARLGNAVNFTLEGLSGDCEEEFRFQASQQSQGNASETLGKDAE